MIQQGPVHQSDEHRHGVGHGGPGPTKQHDPGWKIPLQEDRHCDDCLQQQSPTEQADAPVGHPDDILPPATSVTMAVILERPGVHQAGQEEQAAHNLVANIP